MSIDQPAPDAEVTDVASPAPHDAAATPTLGHLALAHRPAAIADLDLGDRPAAFEDLDAAIVAELTSIEEL